MNVKTLQSTRTWPTWNQRARIKRVNAEGNIIPNEYTCGGQYVRVSPRYMKNGSTFRVRPEAPAAFFASFLYEKGLVPTLLTPEECQQEEILSFLDPLWVKHSGCFFKLESPFAASDEATVPSHRNGFSFCILQCLVENAGTVTASGGAHASLTALQAATESSDNLEALRKQIEQLRARGGRTEATSGKSKK